MSRHHLILDGQIIATREFESAAPQLAPNKGAWLPEEVQWVNFDPVSQVALEDALEIEAERVLRVQCVRDKTPDEIAAMRAEKVKAVKDEARRRILELYPDWVQWNMTARGVVLLNLAREREWTPEESAEAAELQAAWSSINAIRQRSGELEASIPEDPHGIAAFEPTQGWD